MQRRTRLAALSIALPVIFGQVGCALSPEAQDALVHATHGKQARGPGIIYVGPPAPTAEPSSTSAGPSTVPPPPSATMAPAHSEPYVFETFENGLELMSTAHFHEWGGFPVYYPYPYKVPARSYDDPWTRAYVGWPRTFRVSGGTGGGASGRSGSGGAASKTRPTTSAAASGAGPAPAVTYGHSSRPTYRGSPQQAESARGSTGYRSGADRASAGRQATSGRAYGRAGYRGTSRGYSGSRRGGARAFRPGRMGLREP